jgi:hypothetical protein
MRGLAIAALLASACAEKAIEMRLDTSGMEDIDTTCVTQVTVAIWGSTGGEFQCMPVQPGATIAEIREQIRGRFALDIPDDMNGIQVGGLASATPDECDTGDLIFYAGADWDGQSEIALPVTSVLDCRVMAGARDHVVQLVDYTALMNTPLDAAPACAAPSLLNPLVESGSLFSSNLTDFEFFDPTEFWTNSSANPVAGKVTLPVYAETVGSSCPLLVTYDGNFFEDAVACMQTTGATLCPTTPGELEAPIWTFGAAGPSLDQATLSDHVGATLVSVWDATTKRRIAGATVSIVDGDGVVTYGDWVPAQNKFAPRTASATSMYGLAMVYSNEPITIAISAPGHAPVERVVGAPSFTGGALVAVLRSR